MKANNAMMNPEGKREEISFSKAITSEGMQRMIAKAVPNAAAAARLTGTLLSIVSNNEKLKKCKPETIVAAALQGEGEGLIIGHGYYVVPYGDVAAYQRSYKGWIGLAMSTGYYADIDCNDVREGEVSGIDPRKCKPAINFSKYDSFEEREQHPIVGYYAYYELKDGTFRYEYWPLMKILRHADRYAPAFDLKTYEQMKSGKMAPADVERVRKGSPWYDEGGGQVDMCKKTVLRKLLTSGYAPLSNDVRMKLDAEGNGDGVMIPADGELFGADVNPSTGEVIEGSGTVVDYAPGAENENAPQSDFNAPVIEDAPKRKITRQSEKATREAANFASEAAKDYTGGFFD